MLGRALLLQREALNDGGGQGMLVDGLQGILCKRHFLQTDAAHAASQPDSLELQ